MSNILIVEDDEYICRVYERAFRLGGHEIEIAPDGEAAWNTLSKGGHLPDVVIIDISLPKMSGTELLANIQAEPLLKGLPVVILTNSFKEGTEENLLASGADLYLIKIDHEPKDIVARVEELIRKSQ